MPHESQIRHAQSLQQELCVTTTDRRDGDDEYCGSAAIAMQFLRTMTFRGGAKLKMATVSQLPRPRPLRSYYLSIFIR